MDGSVKIEHVKIDNSEWTLFQAVRDIQHAQRVLAINHLGRCFFRGEMSVICHKITVKCR